MVNAKKGSAVRSVEATPAGAQGADAGGGAGCPLCGGERLAPAFEVAERCGKGSVAIYQCLRCSVLAPAYARPASTREATTTQVVLHEHDWDQTTREEHATLVRECDALVRFFEPQLGAPAEERWVAEIGAGRGGLLAALKARGYRVIGCEPSPVLSGIGRRYGGLTDEELRTEGVDDLLAHLEKARTPVRTFFLWHVLEHLREPWDTLRRIAALCQPGDHVLVQCPLVRSDYVYPEHYFFLTETAISGLAESSGFELARLDYDPERAFVGFALRRTTGPVPERAWAGAAAAGGAAGDQLLKLKSEEVRRLRAQLEDQLASRDGAIAAMERLLEERMRGLDEQSAMIRERDARIQSHEDAIAELRRELAAAQAEARRLFEALVGTERGGGAGSRPESLLELLSLHASQRLFQRWQGVRGLRVSDVAPSIGERLTRFVAQHVPAAVATRYDAAALEAQVERVAGRLKGVARRGARVARRMARRGR